MARRSGAQFWRNSGAQFGAIRRNYSAQFSDAPPALGTTTARVQRARMVWLPAAPRRRRQGRRAQRSRDRDLDGRAAAARGGRRQGGDQQRGQLGAELEGGARLAARRSDARCGGRRGAAALVQSRAALRAPLLLGSRLLAAAEGNPGRVRVGAHDLHRGRLRRQDLALPRGIVMAHGSSGVFLGPLPHVHAAAAAGDAAARAERVGAHREERQVQCEAGSCPTRSGCRRASAPTSSSCGGTCSRRETRWPSRRR